jgi:hypothetical protein
MLCLPKISGARRRIITFVGIRRNRVCAFIMMCLALACIAYVLYPTLSPVQVTGGIDDVSIVAPWSVNRVSIDVSPDFDHNKITLQVAVWSSSKGNGTAAVIAILPKSAWSGHVTCPPQTTCDRLDSGQPELDMSFRAKWYSTDFDSGEAFVASSQWVLPNAGVGVAKNKEYISIIRPSISVYDTSSDAISADNNITTKYDLNLPSVANYTWDGGDTAAAPFVNPNALTWFYPTESQPTGDPFNANAPPMLDSGTDLSAQSEDERNLFISGVLLGIAGGSLIAAIQELLAVGEESRPPERGTPAGESRVDAPSNSSELAPSPSPT